MRSVTVKADGHVTNARLITHEVLADVSAQGPVDSAVAYWVRRLNLTVDRDLAIECLSETGAWTDEELADEDDDTLARRILWTSAESLRSGYLSPV